MFRHSAARVLSIASGKLSPTTARRRRLRRRLRHAQRRLEGHEAWSRADATATAARLRKIVGSTVEARRRWCDGRPAPATYLHPIDPKATPTVRAAAQMLLDGRFSPHRSVPQRHERLPPRWDEEHDSRRTAQMYRHSLQWLEPLVIVAHTDGDERAWRLATETIVSWISENSRPPWRSRGAWHDHAVSIRVRVLCWFFELYRRREDAAPAVLSLVVASIHQHALFLADPSTYTPRSNHALETNGSLLAVCATVPELRGVDGWERLALRRLEQYVADAFTDDGFSKEQSPRYHFFILRRLAAVVAYLRAVGRPVPVAVGERLRQATVVWPWLVRADGSLPRVGDTNDHALPQWRRSLSDATSAAASRTAASRAVVTDADPPAPCPSTLANPRTDEAALLVSFAAGYAVLRGHHPGTPGDDDTHVLFKCNYFRYPHFHRDGLSFVLYALGREWLIDPGPHSYEYDRWERRYLCSSSAHNTLEVGARFDLHPVEFVAASRDAGGDRVSVRHLLGHARHTRTLVHRPPRCVRILDEVEVIDGTTRDVRQLFHVHPDCDVELLAGDRVELRAPDGARCVITQAQAGTWRVVRGQQYPEPLGWWSPSQLSIEPITTCSFEIQTGGTATFDTTIEVHPQLRGRGDALDDAASPSVRHTSEAARCTA